MNAIDLPNYCKTTPIPSLKASISMINALLKFGIAKVEVVVMTCLSLRNASSVTSFYPYCPYLRRFVNDRSKIP